MIWHRKKSKTQEVKDSAEAAAKQLSEQKSLVNSLSAWLERRKDQNGFGEDIEITLRPRGA